MDRGPLKGGCSAFKLDCNHPARSGNGEGYACIALLLPGRFGSLRAGTMTRPAGNRSGEKHLSAAKSPLFMGLVLAAIALGAVRRVAFDLDSPLWLDEVFTGAIAIQPTFAGLVQDLLRDVAAPVYYFLMWLWAKVFGVSNLSLRAPSMIFGILAPALVLLKGHPDRLTRWLWAAFAALWIPSFFYATEARAYALLFFLGTAQIILFFRMVSEPSIRSAAMWSACSAVFLLTHYHAALVTGLQGLAYIWLRKEQAVRTWPAALLLTPAAVWMILHLPLLMRFSQPEFAWQKLLGLADIFRLPAYLLGLPSLSWAVFLLIGAAVLAELWLRRRGKAGSPIGSAEAAVVAASILSILIVFGLGFLRPNFVLRYLMGFMPGALLGAAILARLLTHRHRAVPWLVLCFLILSVVWDTKVRSSWIDWRRHLSWQHASGELVQRGARRLIFVWDNPSAPILSPMLMSRVGSFFFDRAGIPIAAEAISFSKAADPNVTLITAANRPGDAIIWIYDLQVSRTAALRHPPALTKLDPSLQCRNYSRAPHGVLACIRSGFPAH